MLEIERKFAVKCTDFLVNAKESYKITQGYLNTDKNRTVRIRTKGSKGFITVKGISSTDGVSEDAEALLKLCEDFAIEKTRYIIPYETVIYEVDVFEGCNLGLVIAEVELETVTQQFEKPEWLGNELTGDERFYNAYLSNHPFKNWTI